MEKLVFKTIKSRSETSQVIQKIERYSGVRLPDDYVNRSKVVGVFLHNQLAACYMLVTQPNLRSLMFVPDQIKKSNSLFSNDDYEMMEVNGLWIGPSLKKPAMQIRVWMHLVKDIFSARKKFVLLMRDKRTKSMEKFMDMTNPISLYEGSPNLMTGEKTHNNIKVVYTTRWNVVLNVPKLLIELWNRNRRSEAFAKQRDLVRALKQTEANYT
ncbi:MAG: hypothetical protein GKR91_13475 [Pseudomonadales bacterium]|nr:hypothetical protein [Pseudomonadales bacterium]